MWWFKKISIWWIKKISIWWFKKISIWWFKKISIWWFKKISIWCFKKISIWWFKKISIWCFKKISNRYSNKEASPEATTLLNIKIKRRVWINRGQIQWSILSPDYIYINDLSYLRMNVKNW